MHNPIRILSMLSCLKKYKKKSHCGPFMWLLRVITEFKKFPHICVSLFLHVQNILYIFKGSHFNLVGEIGKNFRLSIL